ncbi:MAG: glycoside hydrolase family 26 protein [Bacteroidales bacterium]|nr:glycoside hydrolase family 26 protein [Bacteroidales bacterium]
MRKNLLIAATSLLLIQSCANQQPAQKLTPADQLLGRIENIRQKGIMFGHQDDPMYGLTWAYDADSSDIKNVCGDYPAVMGFDLGGIEIADTKNLDSVPFTRMTQEIQKHHKRGGIVTLSWHPRNPATTIDGGGRAGQKFPEGTAWDVSDTVLVSKLLPGGALNGVFGTWMQRVSDFLKTLVDDNGNKIPVIFRPWHENSGSWFWWGEKFCTPDQYRALWNMLQDKLRADGFDNIVWSYSPGMEDNLTEERLLVRYPGDGRVNMIGLDGYQWKPDGKQHFIDRGRQNLDVLCKAAKKHNLIPALTECGMKNLTEPTWWTSTLMPTVEGFPISYLLVWRNYKSEWFGPAPSKPDAEYFRDYYKSDKSLFANDIKDIK